MYHQENYTKLLIYLAIGAFIALFLVSGFDPTDLSLKLVLKNISTAAAIALLFHLVFKRWIWRYEWIPFMYSLIVLVPNLHGTWKGRLHSSWINPETGQRIEPIEITAFIRQSFTHISVEVRTDKMVSRSYIAGFRKDIEADTSELCYTYSSHAFAETIETNPWHDGTARLTIEKGTELKLKGDYWTLRKTIGTMELNRISKNIIHGA